MKHKWHKEICAWANGAEIEWANAFEPIGYWQKCVKPDWDNEHIEYRIKPQPKEPQYLYVYENAGEVRFSIDNHESEWKYLGKTKIKLEQDDE
jgi:hypothetical protein